MRSHVYSNWMVRGFQGFITYGTMRRKRKRWGGGVLGACVGSEVSPISGGVGVPTSLFVMP